VRAPEWNPRTYYLEGTRVTLDGRTYEANESNQRIAPDSPKNAAEGAWRELVEQAFENAT
jgi:chitodextrinase